MLRFVAQEGKGESDFKLVYLRAENIWDMAVERDGWYLYDVYAKRDFTTSDGLYFMKGEKYASLLLEVEPENVNEKVHVTIERVTEFGEPKGKAKNGDGIEF